MDFKRTVLYGISRKRDLSYLLKENLDDNNFYNVLYNAYIKKKPKKRIIEEPKLKLKIIQKRIKKMLDELEYPENVFSGIKGKSYIDNALYHKNSNYFLKLDLSKFFPNTHREKIYHFYKDKLYMSPDVSKIMTDLSTVFVANIMSSDVEKFMIEKEIKAYNHLPSGAPISSILSYLANVDMFNAIENLVIKNNCIISFYVDDIIISSLKPISKKLIKKIDKIVSTNDHILNTNKTKSYYTKDFKKVTGCIISENKELVIPNKIKFKIIKSLNKEEYSKKDLNSLIGLINCVQIFDETKYQELKKRIKRNMKKSIISI